MGNDGADNSRRRFLTNATSVVGAVGAAFVAVPFLSYWQPSQKALAAGAPVEADFGKLESGKMMVVKWRGKPVWIVKRTAEMIADIKAVDGEVADANSKVEEQQPKYCQNQLRSIKDDVFIAEGICTHLGCSPTFMPEPGNTPVQGWKGGFFCPCHGSLFDLAGRVFSGVPAPTNLVVPSHYYLSGSDTKVLIGEDKKEA
ncbi:MAG: ubiquinol-cytochrome c reductase iron-sulfur subunit [Methylococcales bacterium]|jgi:ubiquinol-cytochrome c reductase iron-sulfur subunit|nr:ubiquinol-cytochrome c reductase iron-sulfur subunit [Methylococcales bacterium]MBT7445589.1 ubiquinol-cytochrome c reductase iron-sulfur subunit [Methylococcales bacterium]